MVAIGINPLFLKDVTFTVESDDYKAALSSVTFTPSASVQTWTGFGVGNTFTDVTQATWVVDLEFAQDWVTEGSLSLYLFQNEGETVTATFKPETGPSFTASVVIVPGAIGGAVGTFTSATVQLPVKGRPTLTA